jgi:iron complex transport system substrate-binding protein
MSSAFTIENISFDYTGKKLFEKFSACLEAGRLFGIIGPNGCGKTTLVNLLAGHLRPVEGRILLKGELLSQFTKRTLAKEIALVPQDFYVNFPFTAREVVMMGRYPHMPRFSQPSSHDETLVENAMMETDTAVFSNRMVTELSGGERQRVVIARALAQDTPCLILDEATSNLDIRHAITLLEKIREKLEDKSRTVIAVFQDINLAARFCDELVMMKNGRIEAFGCTTEVLTPKNLRRVFDVEARVRFDSFADANQVTFARKGEDFSSCDATGVEDASPDPNLKKQNSDFPSEAKAEMGPITISSVFWGVLLTILIAACPTHGADASFAMFGNRLIDQSGNEIHVSKPFNRIISLYGAHTENLFALGCNKEIIGVTRNAMYPPEAQKRPAFHYREDAEKFLAAAPDLVLVRPMIARGYPQLLERLQKSAITVVSLQPSNIEEMFLYWRILGLLTGHRNEADTMVKQFQETVAAVRNLTGRIEPKKRVYFESIHSKMKTFSPDSMAIFIDAFKRVYFESIHSKMKTFSPDSMAIFTLECAGGINMAAEAVPARGTNIANFGKERILAMGGNIDVYLAQVGPMNRPTVETIQNEPGFQAIKAVRTGNVHLIDETIVSRPTMRLLEGIAVIGKILYPNRFDKLNEQFPGTGEKPSDGP